ncbi:MAG: LacI family transcriptional regulator, partial [Chloroflexi bacterium]|nr:LacI family transcriptional regulator [Chloroflexota bacterium]
MSNLMDVARRAGVSPMTVSRVVNGTGTVSPKLRTRVEQALAETGYMPITLARSLRAQRTDTIALLLPDMTNPFFTTMAHGVEAAAREAGITMILANSDE